MKTKELKKKIERCKYAHFNFKGDHSCVQAGWDGDKGVPTDEEKCENCPNFKSRYIEFPITVNDIEHEELKYNEDTWHCKMGSLVKVRPCGEEYGNKTYLGFYLGDLPLGITGCFNEAEGIYKVGTMSNPAMYVPELRKIIFGCGSWWSKIKSPEEIKDITDDDISNVWYVKLAKELSEKED